MKGTFHHFACKLSTIQTKGYVTTVALPFTLKKYLKAKEELWKLKYFTIAKLYLIFKTIL
jgi:hypothetical protein